jgi:hypothetical protein
MNNGQMIQQLEDRRLMSTTVIPVDPLPLGPRVIDEPVSEFAAISQQVRIAYIPSLSVGHISQLHAAISWGDNTTSLASFDRNKNGGIDVLGTHAYAKPGTFSIASIVTETPWAPPGGGPTPQYILLVGDINTTATVTPTPPQLTETAAKPFTATLGKFTYFTLDIILTAKITWGDGTTTVGTLNGGDLAQGNWTLTGTHTYAKTGTYTVHATVYSQVAGSKLTPSKFEDFTTLITVVPSAV